MPFFERIQKLDRRVMYVLLALVMMIPMLRPFQMPTVVTAQVQGVYDAVEAIEPDQIAILSGDWGAGTIAESMPQTEALMRHLFRRDIRFAILPFAPQTATLMQQTAERLAKEPEFKGKAYGKDWVNWGWKAVPMFAFLKSMAKNVPGTVVQGYQGKPIESFAAMSGVKTIRDIGFVAHITPIGNLSIWIAFIQSVYRTPLAYAPTAVMVAQGYDPLDAKQIVGMLPGLVGGAQYEVLLKQPGNGLRWSNSLSFADLLMVGLIALANIGYFASKREGSRKG